MQQIATEFERPLEPAERLTLREIEVIWLIAGGCTYAGVGARLGISSHTVAAHIKNTYRKLAVHNAPSAVMRAMQLGLLQIAAQA